MRNKTEIFFFKVKFIFYERTNRQFGIWYDMVALQQKHYFPTSEKHLSEIISDVHGHQNFLMAFLTSKYIRKLADMASHLYIFDDQKRQRILLSDVRIRRKVRHKFMIFPMAFLTSMDVGKLAG